MFITNPIPYEHTDSEDEQVQRKEEKQSNTEDDYENDYENEFEDDQQQDNKKHKKKESDDDGYSDDDFEENNTKNKESKQKEEESKSKSDIKNTQKGIFELQDNSESNFESSKPPPQTSYKKERPKISSNSKQNPKHQPPKTRTKTSSNAVRNKSSSKAHKKGPKSSLFNARISSGERQVNPHENSKRQSSKIRDYNSLNRSNLDAKNTRPGTKADKSRGNRTENVNSLSKIESNNNSKSFSKKRLMSNKSKRSDSKQKEERKVEKHKEQEILITKTYDLSLNIRKKSNNKKISYVNKDEKQWVFTVKSSHPDQMTFKNDEIRVEAGEKAKFSLKFKNWDEPKLAQYVLFLTKDGEPHENILLNVKYE